MAKPIEAQEPGCLRTILAPCWKHLESEGLLQLHDDRAGAKPSATPIPERVPLAPRPGTIICHRPLPMTRLGDCLYIIADDLVESGYRPRLLDLSSDFDPWRSGLRNRVIAGDSGTFVETLAATPDDHRVKRRLDIDTVGLHPTGATICKLALDQAFDAAALDRMQAWRAARQLDRQKSAVPAGARADKLCVGRIRLLPDPNRSLANAPLHMLA